MSTYKRRRFSPNVIYGPAYRFETAGPAKKVRGDTFFIDEVFVKINGQQLRVEGSIGQINGLLRLNFLTDPAN
jgi:hypothetical protein